MELKLADVILHLSRSTTDRFYALLLNCFQRVESDSVPTMAVSIRDGRLILLYSPTFLQKQSFRMACFIVKHEALHIILDHIPRFIDILGRCSHGEEQEKMKRLANLAMDLAVNSILRQDAEWPRVEATFEGEVPERYGLPAKQSFDKYLEALMQRPEAEQQDLSYRLITSHDGWTKPSEEPAPSSKKKKRSKKQKNDKPKEAPVDLEELQIMANQVRGQIKHVVKAAMEEMTKAGGKGIPHGLAEWLHEFTEEPSVPWWELLKTRIITARRTKPIRSIQRPNRVLMALAEEDPTIIPAIGTAYDPSYHVFNVIDVSGSMSNEAVSIGLTETQALLDTEEDMEVRVMQGDDAIVSDQLFKGGDELPRRREASGGTDFNAYFKYIWQHYMGDPNQQPDLVVIYTDGGSYQPLSPELYLPPEIPVIWLMTRQSWVQELERAGYGEVIYADRAFTR